MHSPLPDYLSEVLDACGRDPGGELAAYIPELAAADPDRFALALATPDGAVYGVGDDRSRFTIQSISKPFAYALAIDRHGLDAVLERVGVEPSGDASNELSLEAGTARPLNPTINADALTVHALLDDETVRQGFSAFAGRDLEVDESVLASELVTADRDRAIAFMLRSHGTVERDAMQVVEGYTRQCALLVDVRDLAVMAATLAGGGVQPLTGERVVSHEVTRQVMAVMATCGRYDAAGDWFTTVGTPAKSGVAGGLIDALPGQVGLATFSPRLDPHGNSVRGVQVFERLSRDMGLHLMEGRRRRAPGSGAGPRCPGASRSRAGPTSCRARSTSSAWSGSCAGFSEDPPTEATVLDDLTRVHEIRDVGHRMLIEAVRRLVHDGHDVTLVDPDDLLGALPDETSSAGQVECGDGVLVPVVRTC